MTTTNLHGEDTAIRHGMVSRNLRKRELANICDMILSRGRIEEKNVYDCDGVVVKSFVVSYSDQKYEVVKNDGEWVAVNKL